MSKRDREELPELRLQTVEVTTEARPAGRMAQVETLRDADGQTRGWRVRLDNGNEFELGDQREAEPRRLH